MAGQFCQPGPVLAVLSRLPRASTVSGMFPRRWPPKDSLSCCGLALLHVASDLLETNLALFSWLRKMSEGEGTRIPRSGCFHQVFFCQSKFKSGSGAHPSNRTSNNIRMRLKVCFGKRQSSRWVFKYANIYMKAMDGALVWLRGGWRTCQRAAAKFRMRSASATPAYFEKVENSISMIDCIGGIHGKMSKWFCFLAR